MSPQVKICGVTRPGDAEIAVRAGASYVGTVLVPGSPRRVTVQEARIIGESINVPLVVVVANLEVEEIARIADETGAGAIQLHGAETVDAVARLRTMGEWELWKAARVRSVDDVRAAAEQFQSEVDLILLDGWHETELGGSGTQFPWDALDDLRGAFRREGLRLGVAGGLSPENVADAVERMRPDLVDVSSGVEARMRVKDPEKVRTFIALAGHD